jgi:hypothetical protein
VAERYGISTCNVAVELADQIEAGKTSWEIYGGVHPKPAGNRIAAGLIDQVFEKNQFSADTSTDEQVTAGATLPAPLDTTSFSKGRFLSRDAITLGDGWSYEVPNWKQISGSFRTRFADRSMTVATEPGSTLDIRFSGNAVGLFVLAGPDAGMVEHSIDGGDWETADLYHRYSKGLHYPRTVVLKAGLEDGPHQVKLRVMSTKNDASNGNAIRVLEFVAS